MMQNKIIIGVAALLLIGSMSFFTVNEAEKAIKFELGEIVKYDYEPGMHFKIPVINNVKKFDARILTLDTEPGSFVTAEKKNVTVDAFVKWQIVDVKKFYTATGGDIDQANSRLEPIIKNAFRDQFATRTIKQLVSGERSVIRNNLKGTVEDSIEKEYGIKIVDAQIRRIDLPDDVYDSVYRRMVAERARVASEFRSKGAEEAERIRADADRQREVKLANAYRDAEKLRGEGDAKSAEIYAQAYGEDSEFFAFYRSMTAYQKTFRRAGDKLVIDPDSDFFKYFKKEK